MNKSDFIRRASQDSGIPMSRLDPAFDAIWDSIIGVLAEGDELKFHGYCDFRWQHCAARVARNPYTGEQISVPECDRLRFSPGSRMTSALRGVVAKKNRPAEPVKKKVSR